MREVAFKLDEPLAGAYWDAPGQLKQESLRNQLLWETLWNEEGFPDHSSEKAMVWGSQATGGSSPLEEETEEFIETAERK